MNMTESQTGQPNQPPSSSAGESPKPTPSPEPEAATPEQAPTPPAPASDAPASQPPASDATASNSPAPEAPASNLDDEQLAEADALMAQAMQPQTPAPDQAGQGAEAAAAQPADEPNEPKEIHHEIRRGRISAIRGEDVFVEITGEPKLQGVVPLPQFERTPRIGSIMDFVVDHVEEDQGLIYLSREGAISRATWDQLVKGTVVEARVTGTNKGGLELEMVGNIRAFMPASQIDLHHVGELEPFIGQKLEAVVQEIDRKGRKVLLSRRAHVEQMRKRNREKLLKELEVGQIREGTVSNVVDFGAFVDLGGIDGLVHVTDMAYEHVNKPSDVAKPGDKVKVKVLKLDLEKERIGLGMKQVEPDPWEQVEGAIKTGDTIEGKVVRTANFGAFVEVRPGVEALLPISEMSWKRVHKAEEVVSVGQTYRMAVLNIDPAKQRMTLSLKAAGEDPWIGAERKYAKDTQHEGKVVSVTDFGAFVELETGVEGLAHISELSEQRIGKVEDVLKVGDVKTFRIKDVDEENRKLSLSLKSPSASSGGRSSGGGKGEGDQAPSKLSLPKSAKKAPPKNLKSGLGSSGALGTGLGGLSLDDFK